jgi:cytochrome c-type biogenesis protein
METDLIFGFILGVISIISPCVLPVIPLIFAGSRGEPANVVMLLAGLTVSMVTIGVMSAIISLTPLKFAAYLFMIVFAAFLLSDRLEEKLSGWISILTGLSSISLSPLPSFIFGFLLTFIWMPCITPFLGIAISKAVLNDPLMSIAVILSYGAGMIVSLVTVFLLGEKIGERMLSSIKSKRGIKLRKYTGYVIVAYVFYFIASDIARMF